MFNIKIKSIIALLVVATVPAVTHAETIRDLKSLIAFTRGIINGLIPLILGLAVVGFIWGVTKYIFAANPDKLSEARSYIIYSIIAITVMLSVWSLAFLLKNTFFESSPVPIDAGSGGSGGSYSPDPGSAGTSCSTDDDCTSPYVCQSGTCAE